MALEKKEYEVRKSLIEKLDKHHEITATPINFTPIHYKVWLKEIPEIKAKGRGNYKLSVSHFERAYDSDDFSPPIWKHDLTLYYKSKTEALKQYEKFTECLGEKKCLLQDIVPSEYSLYVASKDMEFEGIKLKANDVVVKNDKKAILIARMDSIDFSNRPEGARVMRPDLKGYLKIHNLDGDFRWQEESFSHEKYPTRHLMLEAEDMYQKRMARAVADEMAKNKDTDYLIHGFAQYLKKIEAGDDHTHTILVVDTYKEMKDMPGVYSHQEKTFLDTSYLQKVVQKDPVAITWDEFREKNKRAYKGLVKLAKKAGKSPWEMDFNIRGHLVPFHIMTIEKNPRMHSLGRANKLEPEDTPEMVKKPRGIHHKKSGNTKER